MFGLTPVNTLVFAPPAKLGPQATLRALAEWDGDSSTYGTAEAQCCPSSWEPAADLVVGFTPWWQVICVGFVEHSSVMLTMDASGQLLKWPYRKEFYSEVRVGCDVHAAHHCPGGLFSYPRCRLWRHPRSYRRGPRSPSAHLRALGKVSLDVCLRPGVPS